MCSTDINQYLENNKNWVNSVLSNDKEYFDDLKEGQHPKALLLGCSDFEGVHLATEARMHVCHWMQGVASSHHRGSSVYLSMRSNSLSASFYSA